MTTGANIFRTYLDIITEANKRALMEDDSFKTGDRIAVTNVAGSPPQVYNATIKTVFAETNTAAVTWDISLPPAVEQQMTKNCKIDLHNARKI